MAKKTQKKAGKTAGKRATRTGEKMGRPPPQRQTQPGKGYEMTPRPQSQAREYLAAGKLRDQVARDNRMRSRRVMSSWPATTART